MTQTPSRDLLGLSIMIMRSLLLVLLFFVSGDAFAFGDDDKTYCKSCESTGLQPCRKHKRAECLLEDGLVYCTEFDGCEVCSGVGWIDCVKCESPAGAEELERRLAGRARGAERHKWIHEGMGRNLRLAETEHFRLVWEIDSLKVKKKRLNGHQLLHLYADRLEQLWEDYAKVLGATRGSFKEKPLVLAWWLPADQSKASRVFCNNQNPAGTKLLGATPRYSFCGNKQLVQNDEALHRSVVHNVTHVLLSHQTPSFWIGNVKGGWADAGLAHWFEDRYSGLCTNYCYQEQNTTVNFKGGKYKLAIRKLVSADKVSAAAVVFEKNTDTLTPEEHAVSFSYVDYLISIDGKKFSNLARMLKKRASTRDALQETYDLNPLEFEAKWKAWVLATYPKR